MAEFPLIEMPNRCHLDKVGVEKRNCDTFWRKLNILETQPQFEYKSFLPTTTVSFVDEEQATSHLHKKLLNFDLEGNEKP